MTIPATDAVDALAELTPDSATHRVRHGRAKVVEATQASYAAMLSPEVEGLSLDERLLVAVLACQRMGMHAMQAHYAGLLDAAPHDAQARACAMRGDSAAVNHERVRAILVFAQTLIDRPVEGDRAALMRLQQAGLTPASIIALAQWIAFLSYQVRLVAGLAAMRAAEGLPAPAAEPVPDVAAAPRAGALGPLDINGFTNATLGWRAWLETVDVARATPEQIAVLEESHPQAKTSDYYLALVHQPAILRHRSAAFNAIMYAPGGLSRAERELGATVVSCINGCVFCASVHAQRFEQLAKRQDVIAQVFDNPRTAGTTPRERAIVNFSARLTEQPASLAAQDILALRSAGLTDAEILDLLHADAIFAWANRLMLNLGEPVMAEA